MGVVACERADGWIVVGIDELMKQGWRRHSDAGFGFVDLDMNGDGVSDRASLVTSGDGVRSAIEICFGTKDVSPSGNCRILAEGVNVYFVMGLAKRSAGCYEYYEDDAAGAGAGGAVCTQFDVLEYFRFGSSGSFFIYDKRMDNFRRYWDSY